MVLCGNDAFCDCDCRTLFLANGFIFATKHPSQYLRTGMFPNARDFTINGGQFIDASNVNDMKVIYLNNVISSGKAVFELLEPYACLDAAQDSSARYPPPRCHPGTRSKIRNRLMSWLCGNDFSWKMLWVRGFAGTGKSAVAQSFAEACDEEERLGGSYFFSRTTGRNKLQTVVPTLVSQLAACVPEYHLLIEQRLARNPFLLQKSPPIQFRKLIVEPFSTLQRQRPLEPVAVILDGLDECEGENAQLEILDMITNAICKNPDLPLRWLIFSRPEAHLKDAFLKLTICGREELIIDAECREEVAKYTRERMAQIKDRYRKFTPLTWPPPDQLNQLLGAVSGLFIFASTCLNYISDPREADPQSQLNSLLMFLHRSQRVVSRNPLAALDLLYSRILEDITPSVFKTTRRILAYKSLENHIALEGSRLDSAQSLCNFLRIEQHTFHKAVQGLYSVMSIPDPENAARSQLQFHHASFLDYLIDPNRSGRFFIDEQEALAYVIHLGIFWYEVDVRNFHTHDGWDFDLDHKHEGIPGLTWLSDDNGALLSKSIMAFIQNGLFTIFFDMLLEKADQGLLSQIYDVDFRHWYALNVSNLVRLCQLDVSTSVVRIEPSSSTDHRLLEYFNLVVKNGIARPAVLPLRKFLPLTQWTREYFFLGHGVKSVIVWRTQSPVSQYAWAYLLRCDKEPSSAQIAEHQEYLQEIWWDEETAKLEMKKQYGLGKWRDYEGC